MRTTALKLLFAILLLAPLAEARSASFSIGATVVSGRGDSAHLDPLPLPQGSQAMRTDAAGRHHAYAGSLDEASDFYRQAMPADGYRLLSERLETSMRQQVWDNGVARVVVQLQAALGSAPMTRISLQAGKASPLLAAR